MYVKQLNILLADDDQDDCLFFKKAIEELLPSTNLSVVNDGEELMTYLSEKEEKIPDVLFLDINMPRKNGIECLSAIKQNKKLKDIPIVMFSTANSWDTINMLFNIGAHIYIHKPSDFAQLKQVIYHSLPIAADQTLLNKPLKYILNAANTERPKLA